MDVITLDAKPRAVGKKASRAARRDGDVPCVLYGHRIEPVAFQVPEPSLKPLIYTNETHLVKIEVDKEAWECIIKAIEFHPVTDRPMHADFQVLQAGEKITLSVPVQYVGTPIGQTEGGHTAYSVHELDVSCLPKDIPSHIDVDVSEVAIGDVLHVGDLSIEGIEFLAPPEQILMTVLKPRAVVEEVVDEELLEGEEEEGEEGAAEEPAEEA